jgi:hypothetical protein
VAKVQQK